MYSLTHSGLKFTWNCSFNSTILSNVPVSYAVLQTIMNHINGLFFYISTSNSYIMKVTQFLRQS